MMQFLTVHDVSKLLNISPKTVYEWASREIIPSMKLSKGTLRFDRDEIAAWINSVKRPKRKKVGFS